ncbi:hypothetical protein EI74_0297 [Mycoplasma testudineum]|uniref:Uncharacterized protein n=1 Tax=Mycoplasma testudineum TaxID=244584 RepID=A0A4V3C325_9MOLU|nr:hypothetical protein [Mycoplasma testudineum]OYD26920.1 hypothetical protein CG473_01095 [Mycoplasma testudineum]TDO20469.1 hypothetical protein EI74_0297 [Mycoplasma testudineum]
MTQNEILQPKLNEIETQILLDKLKHEKKNLIILAISTSLFSFSMIPLLILLIFTFLYSLTNVKLYPNDLHSYLWTVIVFLIFLISWIVILFVTNKFFRSMVQFLEEHKENIVLMSSDLMIILQKYNFHVRVPFLNIVYTFKILGKIK